MDRVYPRDEPLEETMVIAERIAAGPSVSYRNIRVDVAHASTAYFSDSLDRETETHIRCVQTEDHAEGVKAFLEKREPVF